MALSKFPRLETEHLMLREIEPADAQAVFRIFADENVTRYHDIPTATHIEQAKSLIGLRASRFQSGQGIRWGIAEKLADGIIGSCGFNYKSTFRAEVGYELAKSHWRKGVMTEALSTMLEFGFQETQIHRFEAVVMIGNIASVKLLEKLGFVEEGLLREYGFWKGQFHDLRLFSLLREDYVKANRL